MLTRTLVFIKHCLEWVYFNLRSARYFEFDGKRYRYLYAFYNATWTAERKIEIPIFLDIIGKYGEGNILEVGNVLRHYVRMRHDVVDKYEVYPRVINEDIVNFKSQKKYDLIISISTLEHVGWDEAIVDSQKPAAAITNLLGLLKLYGRLVFSFPLGYNPHLDKLIEGPQFKIAHKWILNVRAEGMTPRPLKKICIVEMKN